MERKIKIVLADDHPLILKGIIAELESKDNYKVVAAVLNGEEALDAIQQLRPDIAIIDMQMPKKNGIDVLNALREAGSLTKVVILTMFKERYLLKQAIDLGAKGYLIKDTVTSEIDTCIQCVLDDDIYTSKSIVENEESDFEKIPEYSKLTRMEKKVFNLVRQSMTSKAIAEELYLSVKTIENHRYNIGKKLNIKGGKKDILKFLLAKIK